MGLFDTIVSGLTGRPDVAAQGAVRQQPRTPAPAPTPLPVPSMGPGIMDSIANSPQTEEVLRRRRAEQNLDQALQEVQQQTNPQIELGEPFASGPIIRPTREAYDRGARYRTSREPFRTEPEYSRYEEAVAERVPSPDGPNLEGRTPGGIASMVARNALSQSPFGAAGAAVGEQATGLWNRLTDVIERDRERVGAGGVDAGTMMGGMGAFGGPGAIDRDFYEQEAPPASVNMPLALYRLFTREFPLTETARRVAGLEDYFDALVNANRETNVRTVGGGIVDFINNVMRSTHGVTEMLPGSPHSGIRAGQALGLLPDSLQIPGATEAPQIPTPRRPESPLAGAVRTAIPPIISAVGGAGIGAASGLGIWGGMTAGSLLDAAAIPPEDPNFSAWIQQEYPNVVSEFMATNPEDSEWANRARNFAEAMAFGTVGNVAFTGLNALLSIGAKRPVARAATVIAEQSDPGAARRANELLLQIDESTPALRTASPDVGARQLAEDAAEFGAEAGEIPAFTRPVTNIERLNSLTDNLNYYSRIFNDPSQFGEGGWASQTAIERIRRMADERMRIAQQRISAEISHHGAIPDRMPELPQNLPETGHGLSEELAEAMHHGNMTPLVAEISEELGMDIEVLRSLIRQGPELSEDARHTMTDVILAEWGRRLRFSSARAQTGVREVSHQWPLGQDARFIAEETWESRPGFTVDSWMHKLPDAAFEDYHDDVVDILTDNTTNQDRISMAFGLRRARTQQAPGVFEGHVSPGAQTYRWGYGGALSEAEQNRLTATALTRGRLLQQDAVGWHTFVPGPEGVPIEQLPAHHFDMGRPINRTEVENLLSRWDDVAREAGIEGASITPIPTPTGFRLINFGDVDNTAFYNATNRLVRESFPDDMHMTVTHGASQGRYIENNWRTNPNGDAYTQALDELGRGFRARSDDTLRRISPEIEAAGRRLAEQWGPSGTVPARGPRAAGRAGTDAATGQPRVPIEGADTAPTPAGRGGFARTGGEQPPLTRAQVEARPAARGGQAQAEAIAQPQQAGTRPQSVRTEAEALAQATGQTRPVPQPDAFNAPLAARGGRGMPGGPGQGIPGGRAPQATPGAAQNVRRPPGPLAGTTVDTPVRAADETLLMDPEQGRRMAAAIAGNEPPDPQSAFTAGVARNRTINTSTLNDGDSIKNAMQRVAETYEGFRGERRGIQSLEQTRQIADQLGMSVDGLLSRQRGQAFNAPQIMAAADIMAASNDELLQAATKLSNNYTPETWQDFYTALTRNAAIQEQMSGIRAETGRAMQVLNNISYGGKGSDISRFFEEARNATGGGAEVVQDLADDLASALRNGDLRQAGALSRMAYKPDFWDRLHFYRVSGLLSGIRTHTTNIIGNTISTALDDLSEFVGAGIGAISRRPDRVYFREVFAKVFGQIDGTRGALRKASSVWADWGQFAEEGVRKHQQYFTPQGRLGRAAATPLRALSAEDAFFKHIAMSGQFSQDAWHDGIRRGLSGRQLREHVANLFANPTQEMIENAERAALRATFQEQPYEFVQNFNRWIGGTTYRRSIFGGEKKLRRHVGARFAREIIPFRNTPANLARRAIEYSPASAFTTDFWTAIRSGRVAERNRAIAKFIVGSSIIGLAWHLAENGYITGNGPSDPAERNLWRQDHQPYAARFGDTWYSWRRLDPASMVFGFVAETNELWNEMSEREREVTMLSAIGSVANQFMDKTWTTGLVEFTQAMDDPDRYFASMVQRYAGSYVPTMAAHVAYSVDPYLRRGDTVLDAVRKRIPGLSQEVPAVFGFWGEPIEFEATAGEGALGRIIDLTHSFYSTRDTDDPVIDEMLRLHMGRRPPSDTIGGVELTPQQHMEYAQLSHGRVRPLLERMVTSPGYQRLPDNAKEQMIDRLLRRSRDEARNMLFVRYPELMREVARARFERNNP